MLSELDLMIANGPAFPISRTEATLRFFRWLRRTWRWKPEFCCAINRELSIVPRLQFELRFEFCIVFLCSQALKGECVRYILFE